MKNKLSKEAKEYLNEECERCLAFYISHKIKLVKNGFIPSDTKIKINQGYQNKINMFKEILEFIK